MTARNNSERDFDRLMTAWFEADAQVREPEYLVDEVLVRTRRAHRRPGWLLPERWIPMQLTARLQPVPRLAPLVILLALLIAALVAIAVVGSKERLPSPFGPAANGQVAYVSAGRIYTVEPNGSAPRPITAAGTVAGTPAWSPDGTHLAFKVFGDLADTTVADLDVMDADGSHLVVVDPKTAGLSPVTWSNDGRSLMYSKLVGQLDQIVIAAADGSGIRRVGSFSSATWGPVWSPDNKRISFVLNQVGSQAIDGLEVMNVDGSDVHTISHHHFDQYDAGEWSPDATLFAYSAGESGAHSVYLAAANGSSERPINAGSVNSVLPSWSPDGTKIAYLSGAGETGANVTVLKSDGTLVRTVTGRFALFEPRWSPDGSRIAVTDISGGLSSAPVLTLLDASGSQPPVAITTSDVAIPGLGGYDGHIDDTAWQRRAP